MNKEWDYQIRINLREDFALAVRQGADLSQFALGREFSEVLKKYNADIKNQYDAFANYCKEAEAAGDTDSVLYRWTKDTIEKPGKKEQYATRFTVYADGGKEVYSKAVADALEADLQPFVKAGMITKLNKFDANPANNPQAPKRFH
jgi:hypothetical protein